LKIYGISNDVYKSINETIGISLDTLILDYKFIDGILNHMSFNLSYLTESLGQVTTSGYIGSTKTRTEWLSTSEDLSSLQYNAYLSSFMDTDYQFDGNSIFFNIEDKTTNLVKDEHLTNEILAHLGYAPRTKMWSASTRLGEADFALFDEKSKQSNESKLKSDNHNFNIDWMFYRNKENSNNLLSIPSIWNSTNAVFISKSICTSLLLANLTLDIFEIHKIKFTRNK